MAQLMPLPLTVSCFSKIQIGFTILVPADLGSPGKEPLNGCVLLTFLLTLAGCLPVAVGCGSPSSDATTLIRRDGDEATVRCNATGRQWTLHCRIGVKSAVYCGRFTAASPSGLPRAPPTSVTSGTVGVES